MFNFGKWAVFTLKKSPISQGERFLPYRNRPFTVCVFCLIDPRFSLETPRFSLETADFLWRPHIFNGDPQIFIEDTQIFIEDPGFLLDTPVFRWRPNIFIGDSHYFVGALLFSLETSIFLMQILGSQIQISGSLLKFLGLQRRGRAMMLDSLGDCAPVKTLKLCLVSCYA